MYVIEVNGMLKGESTICENSGCDMFNYLDILQIIFQVMANDNELYGTGGNCRNGILLIDDTLEILETM